MEAAASVPEPMLPRRELPEVPRGPRDDIVVKLEHYPSSRLRVNRNVELHSEQILVQYHGDRAVTRRKRSGGVRTKTLDLALERA